VRISRWCDSAHVALCRQWWLRGNVSVTSYNPVGYNCIGSIRIAEHIKSIRIAEHIKSIRIAEHIKLLLLIQLDYQIAVTNSSRH
jgi:hypothetical protein